MPFSNNQGQLTSKSEVILPNLELKRHVMVVFVNYKNEERLLKKKKLEWPHHPQYKSMFFFPNAQGQQTLQSVNTIWPKINFQDFQTHPRFYGCPYHLKE